MSAIKIAMVDDHKIFRQGVRTVLQPVKNFEVVLELSSGQELLDAYEQVAPDVVLMDIKMQGMDGITTTKKLLHSFPAAKVIALSVFDQEIYISNMFEAGARGYLLKDAEPEEIVYAINKVHEGDYHYKGKLSNILYDKLFHKMNKNEEAASLPQVVLSPVEIDILMQICEERTNREISDKLNLSIKTVENYRNKLLIKTGSKNVVGLVTYAIKKGHLIIAYVTNPNTFFDPVLINNLLR